MTRDRIYQLIDNERREQALKWNRFHRWGYGDCSSAGVDQTVKVAVLAEEIGEVSRAVLEADQDALKRELVQVAAVAVAWLESFP